MFFFSFYTPILKHIIHTLTIIILKILNVHFSFCVSSDFQTHPFICRPWFKGHSLNFPKSFAAALIQPNLHVPILLQHHLLHVLIYNIYFSATQLLIYVWFSPLDPISLRVRTYHFQPVI